MNPLDLGVVAVLGLSAIFAFARGFVREALSIVAWVGAALITFYIYANVEAAVEPMVHNPLLSGLIGIAGTFIVCLIVLTIVTGIAARAVRTTGLSPIDRTLGFVFGLLRGAFILSLAYLMLDMVQPNDRPQWLRDAQKRALSRAGRQPDSRLSARPMAREERRGRRRRHPHRVAGRRGGEGDACAHHAPTRAAAPSRISEQPAAPRTRRQPELASANSTGSSATNTEVRATCHACHHWQQRR